ncbi:MAG TPA: methyltransferase domain-containing protein [Bacteroidia bacterium]|nr:methyltransferase domain-containing protein [Bacteroidia bacterium]
MEYPQHQHCTLCGKGPLKPMKGYEKHFLVKCSNCGFVLTSRIPSQQELEEHYNTYSYSYEHYLSPITVQRYNHLLDEFEPFRKTNRLIDVGCGLGFFLVEAAKRGWEVYGTEYSNAAVTTCAAKGIRMKQGELNAADWPADHFDIVTSFEVLEHLNNPNHEIDQIKSILRPGGLFYCTTPNFDTLERYLLKADHNVIGYPEHLSYYTAGTIHKLLTSHGFVREKVLLTGISFTRIRQTCCNSDQKLISAESDDERVRMHIEKRPWLQYMKNMMNGLLTLTRKGLSLKVYYINRK